ncbi:MAG TPA: hypothetical protein VGZ02_16700 [Candidatus Baltobacteraceae bacterium]|jgi:hypothetical protein|nr:hypothetical protein [Candidatus Baltobacteraceae bacterium]
MNQRDGSNIFGLCFAALSALTASAAAVKGSRVLSSAGGHTRLLALIASLVLMAQTSNQPQVVQASPASGNSVVQVPAGDRIDVIFITDVGSRLATEGETFMVQTASGYYLQNHLILPKGSPGIGVVSHVKRAAAWHAGGELAIRIDRLILPGGGALIVQVPGTIGDAQYAKEHNGNSAGRFLLCGWICMQSKKGDDMLIKAGSHLHVVTLQNNAVPAVAANTTPAPMPTASVQPQPTRSEDPYE